MNDQAYLSSNVQFILTSDGNSAVLTESLSNVAIDHNGVAYLTQTPLLLSSDSAQSNSVFVETMPSSSSHQILSLDNLQYDVLPDGMIVLSAKTDQDQIVIDQLSLPENNSIQPQPLESLNESSTKDLLEIVSINPKNQLIFDDSPASLTNQLSSNIINDQSVLKSTQNNSIEQNDESYSTPNITSKDFHVGKSKSSNESECTPKYVQTKKNISIESSGKRKPLEKFVNKNIATISKAQFDVQLDEDLILPPTKEKYRYKCPKCDRKFRLLLHYKRHTFQHMCNDKTYKCHVCTESYNNLDNLKIHEFYHKLEDESVEDEKRVCPICKQNFSRMATLKFHLQSHFQDETLSCNDCGEEFNTEYALELHSLEHKTRNETNNNQCKNNESDKHELQGLKSLKKLWCRTCKSLLNSKEELNQHKIYHKKVKSLTSSKKYRKGQALKSQARGRYCNICMRCFNRPSQLIRHLRVHSGEKPFICDICFKSFNQKNSLDVHKLVHTGSRPHVCHMCNASFTQKGNLRTHISIVHRAPWNPTHEMYRCKHCSCVFHKRSIRTYHYIKVHGYECNKQGAYTTNTTVEPVVENLETKNNIGEVNISVENNSKLTSSDINTTERKSNSKHCCTVCFKDFKKSSDLVRHIRTHTKEKPFQCTQCGKSFSIKSTLTVHMITHDSKRKSWACNDCDPPKYFCHLNSLRQHERLIHSNIPFVCKYCKNEFTSSYQLRKHMLFADHCTTINGEPSKIEEITNNVKLETEGENNLTNDDNTSKTTCEQNTNIATQRNPIINITEPMALVENNNISYNNVTSATIKNNKIDMYSSSQKNNEIHNMSTNSNEIMSTSIARNNSNHSNQNRKSSLHSYVTSDDTIYIDNFDEALIQTDCSNGEGLMQTDINNDEAFMQTDSSNGEALMQTDINNGEALIQTESSNGETLIQTDSNNDEGNYVHKIKKRNIILTERTKPVSSSTQPKSNNVNDSKHTKELKMRKKTKDIMKQKPALLPKSDGKINHFLKNSVNNTADNEYGIIDLAYNDQLAPNEIIINDLNELVNVFETDSSNLGETDSINLGENNSETNRRSSVIHGFKKENVTTTQTTLSLSSITTERIVDNTAKSSDIGRDQFQYVLQTGNGEILGMIDYSASDIDKILASTSDKNEKTSSGSTEPPFIYLQNEVGDILGMLDYSDPMTNATPTTPDSIIQSLEDTSHGYKDILYRLENEHGDLLGKFNEFSHLQKFVSHITSENNKRKEMEKEQSLHLNEINSDAQIFPNTNVIRTVLNDGTIINPSHSHIKSNEIPFQSSTKPKIFSQSSTNSSLIRKNSHNSSKLSSVSKLGKSEKRTSVQIINSSHSTKPIQNQIESMCNPMLTDRYESLVTDGIPQSVEQHGFELLETVSPINIQSLIPTSYDESPEYLEHIQPDYVDNSDRSTEYILSNANNNDYNTKTTNINCPTNGIKIPDVVKMIPTTVDHSNFVSQPNDPVMMTSPMMTNQPTKTVKQITYYRCGYPDCDRILGSEFDLKTHNLTHEQSTMNVIYKCDQCSSLFDKEFDCKVHQMTHQKYKCMLCMVVFQTLAQQKIHVLREHCEEFIDLPVNISLAKKIRKTITSSTSLGKRRSKVSPKKDVLNQSETNGDSVSCITCETIFSSRSHLNDHIKQSHAKPEKQTRITRNIIKKLTEEETRTILSRDPVTLSEKVLIDVTIEKENPPVLTAKNRKLNNLEIQQITNSHANECKTCPKSFKKLSDLIRHERTHTGEKPFSCDICTKSFRVKSAMIAHKNTHLKEKLFTCHLCSHVFTFKASLKVHMRLHSDSKPFICPIVECGKRFITTGNRTNHLKVHHPEEEEYVDINYLSFHQANLLHSET